MSPSFDIWNFWKRQWYQMRLDPFFGPSVAGCTVLTLLLPWLGSVLWYSLTILWAALWAGLECAAKFGWPPGWVRELTPNFFAVRDLGGRWRIFQRPPCIKSALDCREALRLLLREQSRLPAALSPGRYWALTHDAVLRRLRMIPGVVSLTSKPVYVATLEHTVSRTVHRHCKRCNAPCPFYGRQKRRQFYSVKFEIQEEPAEAVDAEDIGEDLEL